MSTMKLIPNAKEVANNAWSVRLWFVACALEVIGLAWPLIQTDVQALVEPKIFHIIAVVAGLSGVIARFIKQRSVSGDDNAV